MRMPGTLFLLLLAVLPARAAFAADPGEKIQVDKLKERYWAKGEDSELRVVQNRLYSKAQKFEMGLFTGVVSTDPFLSVHNFGGSLAYHVSDFFGVAAIAWRDVVHPSAALSTLEQDKSITANTNYP